MQFALSQRQAMELIAGRIKFATEERRLCGAEAWARKGAGREGISQKMCRSLFSVIKEFILVSIQESIFQAIHAAF